MRESVGELRAKLCEAQCDSCFLCGKWMQSRDGVIVAVDHAIPVYIWAESYLPIAEVCQYANDSKNLGAAHTECNTVKQAQDADEWFEAQHGDHMNVATKSSDKIETLRKRLSCAASKAGRIAGRKNVESGHLAEARKRCDYKKMGSMAGSLTKQRRHGIFGLSPQQRSMNSKLGGRIGGKVSGGNHAKNGTSICGFTFEQRRNAGLKGGRKCVESGQLARARKNCDYKKMAAISGRIASETGQARASVLAILAARKERLKNDPQFAQEISNASRRAMHIRWHIKRGVVNVKCSFCIPQA
jgi:hypothetical protein